MRPGEVFELEAAGQSWEMRVAQASPEGVVAGCTCCDGATVALVGDDQVVVRTPVGAAAFDDFKLRRC